LLFDLFPSPLFSSDLFLSPLPFNSLLLSSLFFSSFFPSSSLFYSPLFYLFSSLYPISLFASGTSLSILFAATVHYNNIHMLATIIILWLPANKYVHALSIAICFVYWLLTLSI
jgi:hypothetical protein